MDTWSQVKNIWTRDHKWKIYGHVITSEKYMSRDHKWKIYVTWSQVKNIWTRDLKWKIDGHVITSEKYMDTWSQVKNRWTRDHKWKIYGHVISSEKYMDTIYCFNKRLWTAFLSLRFCLENFHVFYFSQNWLCLCVIEFTSWDEETPPRLFIWNMHLKEKHMANIYSCKDLYSDAFLKLLFHHSKLFFYQVTAKSWKSLSTLRISWSIMSSVTCVMYVWSFCTRAPSGFQYEWNRH